MIIYGSRMYGRRDKVPGWGSCPRCGKYGKHTSYTGRKWGHLYFIPLIPEGPRVRVLQECRKCSHGMHVPEKDLPTLRDGLQQDTEKALTALIAGEDRFAKDGETMSATACLAGSVEMLLCLQADGHLRLILAAMQQKQLTHAYCLAHGRELEFQGEVEEAIKAYQQAAECKPDDPLARTSLGFLFIKMKDYQRAKEAFEKALVLSDERFPVLEILLFVYDALKEHTLLAQAYEACFALVPELAHDKKARKAYRSACQKAGKQPLSE